MREVCGLFVKMGEFIKVLEEHLRSLKENNYNLFATNNIILKTMTLENNINPFQNDRKTPRNLTKSNFIITDHTQNT